jgi:hypothetical protein
MLRGNKKDLHANAKQRLLKFKFIIHEDDDDIADCGKGRVENEKT